MGSSVDNATFQVIPIRLAFISYQRVRGHDDCRPHVGVLFHVQRPPNFIDLAQQILPACAWFLVDRPRKMPTSIQFLKSTVDKTP
jgi:hypothetical protein